MTVHDPVGCHFRVVYRSWAVLVSPESSICNSGMFLPLHRLCHSLCSLSSLLTRLLSLGSKVSPSQCLHSQCSKAPEVPPWSTRSCMNCMWAWTQFGAQQMQQGLNLTQGWGSSSTSLCPTKLNPQHLPSCQEERGAGTPQPPLTNIPQQVHSCRQAEGRG